MGRGGSSVSLAGTKVGSGAREGWGPHYLLVRRITLDVVEGDLLVT